jgi:hypothetical protein
MRRPLGYGAPGRTRTSDLSIRLECSIRLSYGGPVARSTLRVRADGKGPANRGVLKLPANRKVHGVRGGDLYCDLHTTGSSYGGGPAPAKAEGAASTRGRFVVLAARPRWDTSEPLDEIRDREAGGSRHEEHKAQATEPNEPQP